MNPEKIGFLHPGAMGISLAASAQNSGHTAYWAGSGRSPATRLRAEQHQLLDAGDLAGIAAACDVLVSICPPHAAEEVAGQVTATGFRGLYIDANAIAPQKAVRIARMLEGSGAAFVDGGVIGGPAWEPGRTWLYLSGPRADEAAALFTAGPLETQVISRKPGDASALKMCFAAYTKGSTALLAAVLGAAEALGVRESLWNQWSRGGSDFAEQTGRRVRGVTAKAWRFEGEMHEIAATFSAAGQPPGFHEGAAEVYRRLAAFKEGEMPALQDVLDALLERE